MGTTLHTLAPNPGATRKKKRVGRGSGSGTGKTAGRGQKGQKSRTGHHGSRVGFEGGQMPMQRRLPKRGFTNPFRVETHPVNLSSLMTKFAGADGATITLDDMRQAGLVPKKAKVVKVLGRGDFTLKATVQAHRFSKSAMAKIQAAGGTAEIVGKGAAPAKDAAPAKGAAPAKDAAPAPAAPAKDAAPAPAAPAKDAAPAPAAKPAAPAAPAAPPAAEPAADKSADPAVGKADKPAKTDTPAEAPEGASQEPGEPTNE